MTRTEPDASSSDEDRAADGGDEAGSDGEDDEVEHAGGEARGKLGRLCSDGQTADMSTMNSIQFQK